MKGIFVLALLFLLIALAVPLAQAEEWEQVEYKTFSSDNEQAFTFTVQSSQWRIRWSYEPTDSGYTWSGDYAYLGVNVFDVDGHVANDWETEGHSTTSGTEEMWGAGIYTIKTYPANLDSYRFTIEQVVETPTPSVPEFNAVVILALVLAASLCTIIAKKHNQFRISRLS